MTTRLGTLAAALLAMLGSCPGASADIVPTGDPLTGGSWGHCFAFTSDDGTSADMVALLLQSGGPFEAPTFRRLDTPDWEIQLDTKDLAAVGDPDSPVAHLNFEVWFDAEPTEPLSFVFGAWHPGDECAFEAYELTWSPSTRARWIASPYPYDFGRPTPTSPPHHPVPALPAGVLAMIGVGMVSFFAVLRKTLRA